MSFEIRPAVPEDAPGIAKVHVLSWQQAYKGLLPQNMLDDLSIENRTQQWAHWLHSAETTYNLVAQALSSSEILGFVSGGPLRENRPDFDAEIAAIYLLPAAKGQGLGRELFQTMQNWLGNQGYQRLLVWVLESNQAARGFYEHLGGLRSLQKRTHIGNPPHEVDEVGYSWNLIKSSS